MISLKLRVTWAGMTSTSLAPDSENQEPWEQKREKIGYGPLARAPRQDSYGHLRPNEVVTQMQIGAQPAFSQPVDPLAAYRTYSARQDTSYGPLR